MHAYGAIPDTFDSRDLMFADHPVYIDGKVEPLPSYTINRNAFPIPIRNQGAQGSCTGHGLARALQLELMSEGHHAENLSPAFVYYEERVIEGDTGQDSGAQIRDGIKVLANSGACPEQFMPYSDRQFNAPPSAQAVKAASGYGVKAYHRVTTVHQAKVALAARKPVVIGFTVYEQFENNWTGTLVAGRDSVMCAPMPKRGETILGGHCVCVEDFADDRNVAGGGGLIAANSWGPEWKSGGYFALPYGFWAGGRVSDCWALDVA